MGPSAPRVVPPNTATLTADFTQLVIVFNKDVSVGVAETAYALQDCMLFFELPSVQKLGNSPSCFWATPQKLFVNLSPGVNLNDPTLYLQSGVICEQRGVACITEPDDLLLFVSY